MLSVSSLVRLTEPLSHDTSTCSGRLPQRPAQPLRSANREGGPPLENSKTYMYFARSRTLSNPSGVDSLVSAWHSRRRASYAAGSRVNSQAWTCRRGRPLCECLAELRRMSFHRSHPVPGNKYLWRRRNGFKSAVPGARKYPAKSRDSWAPVLGARVPGTGCNPDGGFCILPTSFEGI